MLLMLKGLFRMLNNRGQSLVLFVIILPIILLILLFVIDIGQAINLKLELDNINNIALDYGLDYLFNDDLVYELEELIKTNKQDIDSVNINVEDNKIYIDMNEQYDGILSSLINVSIFDIKTSYVGYIENDEKRIENLGD